MRKAKKLTALMLLAAFVFAFIVPVTAMAETTSGTITINDEDKTKVGKDYDLYKIFDLTYDGTGENLKVAYTIADKWTNFFIGDTAPGKDYLVDTNSGELNQVKITTESGTVTKYINITESNIATFAEKALSYATTITSDATKPVAASGKTVVDGLDLGYYLVYPRGASGKLDGQASICSLNSTAPSATVDLKAVYPTIEKKVEDAKVNEASIGDDITFTLTSKVPDLTGYKWYKFVAVDTLSAGLTYKEVTSIKIGDTELVPADETATKKYEVKADGQTIRFVLPDFVAGHYTTDADIVITYKATLNENANIGTANGNSAKLEYSNNPSYTQNNEKGDNDFDETEPKGESATSETETFTTSLQINKIHKVNGVAQPLTGAAFRITGAGVHKVITTGDVYVEDNTKGTYWKLKDGTYTTDNPATEGMNQDKYASTTIKYAKKASTTIDGTTENVNVEAFVDENGHLTFAGLGEGTYTISEIVVPDGYNKIDDFTVTIDFDETAKTFSLAKNGETIESGKTTLSMDVENQSGTLLPSTGGIGTTIFYVVGAALVLGAGVLLVTKKRMTGQR